MTREVRTFAVTIPTGSTSTTPHKTQIAFPPRVVRSITVRVPPGPRGVMGFAIGVSGTPLIPYNPGGFIVTNDETLRFDIATYPTSGDWWVIGYNTGTHTHTIYVTFYLTLTGTKAGLPKAALTAASVSTPGKPPGSGSSTSTVPTPTVPTPPTSPVPPPPTPPPTSLPTLPAPPTL